jgi:hypothetical protein
MAGVALPGLVSDTPASYTPNVTGAACYDPAVATSCRQVRAYEVVGDTVYAGGAIDSVLNPNGSSAGTYGNVLAFNLRTGVVDTAFRPLFKGSNGVYDGTVNALLASPDGKSLFIGGDFKTVNGRSAPGLVKWDLATNTQVTGFLPRIGADGSSRKVNALAWVGGQLWVGGFFTSAGGASRRALASLDPVTGNATGAVNVAVAGASASADSGATSILKIAVNPAASRAVLIGNFTSVSGAVRYQVAMLNIDAAGTASLAGWAATYNTTASQYGVGSRACTANKSVWVRDVDWAPDGGSFVLAGTGGGHYYPSLCDSVSRWPVPANPVDDTANVYPLWINYSNADTFLSVRTSGSYAYAGGHQKSMNYRVYRGPGTRAPSLVYQDNSVHTIGSDTFSGEVHYGLTALDTATGLAVPTWNAGSSTERGKGWSGMQVTSSGLLVGGDVSRLHGFFGHRIGYLPLL